MTTPVKASFASAVQSGTSTPQPPSVLPSSNSQQKQTSPVVKLPTLNAPVKAASAPVAAPVAPASKPLITIDSDSPASTKVNSVKFGSFAAAASNEVKSSAPASVNTPASAPVNASVNAPVSSLTNGNTEQAHQQQQQYPQHQQQQQYQPRYGNYQYQPRPYYHNQPYQHQQQQQQYTPRPSYTPRPRPPYYEGAVNQPHSYHPHPHAHHQPRPQFHAAPAMAIPVAPVVAKPASAPLKLKLVDPLTGKEIQLGSKTDETKAVEPVAEPVADIKIVEPAADIKVVEPVTAVPVVTAPVSQAATASNPPPLLSLKKLGITIKDPNSNIELDINQVLQRKVASVDDLTSAMSGLSTQVDEKKELLADLRVEDDDVSDGEDDDDFSNSDYDESEEGEDEETGFLPSNLQYGKAITYPPQFIPYLPPADESGVWRYSRAFLLQFQPVCTTTPTDLHERLSAAVERAKAFARSTDRNNGRRRDSRRGGDRERDPDRKRRSNNGLLGPQAHLLDPNAVLKNRADNAWVPVKSVEELSAVERVLREVKGLLNKLTIEKFTVISDKILALEIMSSDVLSGVIDCVFDKSVEEPRFAAMYAELCYKIIVFEMNAAKKTAGESRDSQFRKFLVERCQAEYKHKRAWSKQRLEKLSGETESKPVVDEATSAATEQAKVVGELTEEDYLMIKLKRRVLGNMRFIGEIFKVGLIGEKIMHSIITELLSNVENPEEEEIECLCRLLMTVGSILDKPEAANFWSQYIARLQWLIAQTGKLSSRIRFMLMDVLEARERGWRGLGRDEGPKSIAQIEKESKEKEREARDREQRDRDRDRDHRRHKESSSNSNGPVRQFTAKKSAANDDWSRTGSGSNRPSRQASVRASERPTSPIPSTTSSVPINRYETLLMEEDETASTMTPASPAPQIVDDSAQVKKIVSLWAEFVQMNNVADLCEEFSKLASSQGKADAISGLVNKAVDAGKKTAIMQLLSLLGQVKEKQLLSQDDFIAALESSFGMIDDLAVDIPAVFELAGGLMAGLEIEFDGVMKCLAACSDAQAKGKVCLYAAKGASAPEYREKMLEEAKSLIQAHQSLISLQERLMK